MPASTESSVERDDLPWAEPFSAMYARIRYQSYLVLGLVVVVLVEGGMLFTLASRASAHVYEVRPDGKAEYIGDRDANLAARPSEARYVARRFVELLYGWNSSTALEDVTSAVNMCSKSLGEQLARELATSQFVANLRKRNVRSEIEWKDIQVLDQGRRDFRVRVSGRAKLFPITLYEVEAIDVREFDMTVVLGVVPREPDRRENGLEVLRIERHEAAAAQAGGEQ